MKRRIFTVITALLLIIILPITAFAHSGRTDSSGGHRDNKNKSGLGSYHYHCGGYPAHLHRGGVCPYRGGRYSSGSSSSSSSSNSTPAKVYSSRIDIEDPPTNIDAGESVALVASVYPSNAEDKTITWESSDMSIATVNSNGVIKAVGVGTVIITAKTSKGTTSEFTITIDEVVAESIEITDKESEVLIGEKLYLDAAILPKNTTYKHVDWESSNEDVIEIDGDGRMVATGVGKAKITAKHDDLSDSFYIEVKPIMAESIEVFCFDPATDEKAYELIFEKGTVLEIAAKVLPRDTTDPSVKWSVDSDKATINDDGTMTLNKIGKVIVTGETINGLTDSFEIEIKLTQIESSLIALSIVSAPGITGIVAAKKIKDKKKKAEAPEI